MKLFIAAAVVIAVLVQLIIRRRQREPSTSADHVRAGDRALGRGDLDAACQHYREAIRLGRSNA